VTEVKIEVMENLSFISEARQKELEPREGEEASTSSMPVLKKEMRKLSFSPHLHHCRGKLEAYAASAIQQPVVEHEQEWKLEVMGASDVLPPLFLPKLPVLLRNKAVLLSKAGSSVT